MPDAEGEFVAAAFLSQGLEKQSGTFPTTFMGKWLCNA